MLNVYINKKEMQAILDASEQVRNTMEGFTGDTDGWVYNMLQETLDGLNSLHSKAKNNSRL